VPTSAAVLSGSVQSGTYSSLASDNSSYYVVRSTTSGTRTCSWYGSTTISQSSSSVSSLTVTYNGKNSASKTQYLYLYNFSTSAWVQIDSRTVSTTDVTVTYTTSSPANYISSAGVIRLRVYSSAGSSTYTSSGDYMQFAVTTSGVNIASSLAMNENVEDNAMQEVSASTGTVAVPERCCLHAAFPNPFNPATTIQYDLAENAVVSLKVYNTLGQEVATLVNNEQRPAGMYQTTFHAAALASGVYFCRFIVHTASGETYQQTNRMSLLK
jgi:hypothetical protein